MNILKKIFATVLFTGFFVSAIFCYSRAKDTVVGHIQIYGNAPVTYAGIVTVEGQVYTIYVPEGSDFSVADITAKQGSPIELTGKIDKSQKGGFQVLKDGVFTVYEWRVLE